MSKGIKIAVLTGEQAVLHRVRVLVAQRAALVVDLVAGCEKPRSGPEAIEDEGLHDVGLVIAKGSSLRAKEGHGVV